MSGVPSFSNQLGHYGLNLSILARHRLNPELKALLHAADNLEKTLEDFSDQLGTMTNPFAQSSTLSQCAPVAEPIFTDCTHPAGSLKADDDVVTTPGGYKIEMLGQYEWKITGPDGKSTRVWGDPHVAEGDGGTWDFKRNSTFVLGDGTRINVNTVPGGAAGNTVTSALEIISGNDRVMVTDIDKGKGQVGTVTQDGYQHVNSFGDQDVFVMGQETDDWSFRGKEIIGSENGGESFKTGGDLHPLTDQVNRYGGGREWASAIFSALLHQWRDSIRSNDLGSNPYYRNTSNSEPKTSQRYERDRHMETLRESFRAMAQMFDGLASLIRLTELLATARHRPMQV